jgi:penicillin amidase
MRISSVSSLAVFFVSTLAVAGGGHRGHADDEAMALPGLHGQARVLRDADGIPHVQAFDEHDALFLQGWLQAEDRLFQIDVLRRTARGTLAELLGAAALPSDVELQVIGLGRAAERSLAAYSPAMLAGLQAYADGVNAWVAHHPLPPEYAALELTKFDEWTPLDGAVIGKALAFQLSFDLDDGATTAFQTYAAVLGAEQGSALFFQDLYRSAPFDPASSVPDSGGSGRHGSRWGKRDKGSEDHHRRSRPWVDPDAARMLQDFKSRAEKIPFLRSVLHRRDEQIGSNEWAVAGWRTKDGRAIVANDPHLSLNMPANFYPIQLTTRKDDLDVSGMSVTGTPWVVLGQNRYVTWGETTTGFDVTDTYLEQLVPDPTSPSGVSTLYMGQLEHVIPVPLTFRVNARNGTADGPDTIVTVPAGGAIPAAALIVPRRNNGPIVAQLAGGQAISVQYTGFSGTRDLETFRLLNHARNLDEFKEALQYFDVGSQNFIYGDIEGNIGYFTTGEVPLREDLEQGFVNGAPPWFIRNGQGGNEWLPYAGGDRANGTGYAAIPFEQLPQVVNPKNGFVVNANNDPAGVTLDNDPLNQMRPGGGLYFLGYTFDLGTRGGRITQALEELFASGRVDREDMKAIQADVKLLDAEVFTPYLLRAFDGAGLPGAPDALKALAGEPAVAEAIGRLRDWDYSTPTGAESGYDSSDTDGVRLPPSADEVERSIAATIYSVWRGQMIRNTIDATLDGIGAQAGLPAGAFPRPGSDQVMRALRHLVEQDGIGDSGIDFFQVPGVDDPAQRRDIVLLASLQKALERLAGDAFADAFGNSTNQSDYVWGKLHRIVFDDALNSPYGSIPGSTPAFPPSFAGLAGLATDGGFGVVDASSHNPRAQGVNDFMFGSGPNRRYVGTPGSVPGSIEAESALPGGVSGVVGSEFYAGLLGRWLTNDTFPLRQTKDEIMRDLYSRQEFEPARQDEDKRRRRGH